MTAAAHISLGMGTLTGAEVERQRTLLKSYGLPVSASGLDREAIYDAVSMDKKTTGGLGAVGPAGRDRQGRYPRRRAPWTGERRPRRRAERERWAVSWSWLTLLGLGAGSLGAAVGAGGGIVLVPMLLALTDLEPPVVVGTSLALVAITGITISPAYMMRGLVDKRGGFIFGLAAIPGSVIAPFLVEAVAGGIFRVMLALLVLALAVRMLAKSSDESERGAQRHLVRVGVVKRRIEAEKGQVFEYEYSEPLAAPSMWRWGSCRRSSAPAAATYAPPCSLRASGSRSESPSPTSMFAMAFYATAGTVVHSYLDNVNWAMVLWMGVGTLVGGQIGAKAAATVRATWIVKLLTLMLIAIGLRLLIQGIFQS